jgi:hypothetical protein
MPDPAIIRCAIPDCDWGFEITDFSRMDQCYPAYGQHCIEMHHAEAESGIHFDLVKLMLSLREGHLPDTTTLSPGLNTLCQPPLIFTLGFFDLR